MAKRSLGLPKTPILVSRICTKLCRYRIRFSVTRCCTCIESSASPLVSCTLLVAAVVGALMNLAFSSSADWTYPRDVPKGVGVVSWLGLGVGVGSGRRVGVRVRVGGFGVGVGGVREGLGAGGSGWGGVGWASWTGDPIGCLRIHGRSVPLRRTVPRASSTLAVTTSWLVCKTLRQARTHRR